jgi:hypothetical protein
MGIGMGANVVGGLMQSVAATMAKHAQEKEFAREIQRQQRYRNEAFNTFQPAVQKGGVETARTEISQGAEKRNNAYEQVGQSQFGVGGGLTQRDKATYGLLGNNRAQLGGYSDWALNRMIANIRTQDELNRISNFAGGTAQVFPAMMEQAGHKGDELAFWGSLISSLGGGAGSFIPKSGGPAFGSMYPGPDNRFYQSVPNDQGGGYSAPTPFKY